MLVSEGRHGVFQGVRSANRPTERNLCGELKMFVPGCRNTDSENLADADPSRKGFVQVNQLETCIFSCLMRIAGDDFLVQSYLPSKGFRDPFLLLWKRLKRDGLGAAHRQKYRSFTPVATERKGSFDTDWGVGHRYYVEIAWDFSCRKAPSCIRASGLNARLCLPNRTVFRLFTVELARSCRF